MIIEVDKKYSTNQAYILKCINITKEYYIFMNQFEEMIVFNKRLEQVSLLGSSLKINSEYEEDNL